MQTEELSICVESDWVQYNNTVADQIAKGDIANFTNWDIIRHTMFTPTKGAPLIYLQELPDWHKWEKVIIESPVGNPEPYKSYPQSSGHLIMQAEHLSRFLSHTKCKLENLREIYEFGAGYGCMCRLIHNLGFSGKYVIMDLPALLRLQNYYLGKTTRGRIKYLLDETDFVEQMTEEESLFIATWSISEISYEMRQRILSNAVRSKYIFIIFQAQHNHFDNVDFFEKFVKENTDYSWIWMELSYAFPIKHYYLFGVKGNIETEMKKKVLAQKECATFIEMTKDDRFKIGLCNQFRKETRFVDAPYIFHTAWAARILARLRPEKHVDISSSSYFTILVSAFIPIESYEFQTLDISLSGLQTNFADLNNLPFPDNSIPSLSCMHAVEHIGLGRYGDPLDPEGDLKAIKELRRVLAGDLLFVVPVSGRPKVIFNLHRIYSYDQIMSYFSELRLMEFALISDKGHFVENASKELADKQNYGCGCFWFRKD